MTLEQAVVAVIRVIADIQEMSGRDCTNIGTKTIPIGDVPGFDSLNALEATVVVEERLNLDIPNDENLFINKAGDQALSVSEIATRLMGIESNCEGQTHGK